MLLFEDGFRDLYPNLLIRYFFESLKPSACVMAACDTAAQVRLFDFDFIASHRAV